MRSRICALLLLTSACAVDPGEGAVREVSAGRALVGGREAAADPKDPYLRPTDVPSTVFIGNCTAAKVGDRQFLTAGHCVIDEEQKALAYGFEPGGKLVIYHGVQVPKARAYSLTVTRTSVFPDYVRAVLNRPADERLGRCKADAVDLALIEVAEDTDILPSTIDFTALAVGQRVVVGGYGCEYDVNNVDGTGSVIVAGDGPEQSEPGQPDDEAGRVDTRLKIAPTTIDFVRDAAVSFRNRNDGFSQFKLCPGDSGGPVYLNDAPDPDRIAGHVFTHVVAVNACGGLADSTMARLDDDTPLSIATCLREAVERPADAVAPSHDGFTLLCDR